MSGKKPYAFALCIKIEMLRGNLLPLPIRWREGWGEGFMESLLPLRACIGTMNRVEKLRRSAMSIAMARVNIFKLQGSGMLWFIGCVTSA